MCGIAGLFYEDRDRPCSAEVVTRMRDVMEYRGPDGAGLHVDGPLGLGHRRLSVIDLACGAQPMSGGRPGLWIVFNGEIYNFRELRRELESAGRTLRTNSDTEVILHLYAERGADAVHALNGMFAFAIWDEAERSLFLARDRMGVKPLYYAATSEAFVFASEIKAIFASGLIQAECRTEALAEYMVFRQVAGDTTLFRDVMSLPPGCTMTIREGRRAITRYWSPRPTREPLQMGFDEATEALDSLLRDSVRLRLVSDVPLGTFCSGGVDSSLVTGIAATLRGTPINTYSVGFDESEFDESDYARMAAQRHGTIHHELTVGNAEFAELFPRMVWHNDEPLDFANSVHIFALSRLAKEEVTVVLTGEGSDELFGGYPRYRIPGLVSWYRHVPMALRRMIAGATRDHRLRKLNRFAGGSVEDALFFNASYLDPDIVGQLCPSLPGLSSEHRHDSLRASDGLGLDTIGRASLLDQESFLVSILHRQDKMSMAASIESRVPFMDYRIVEWANRLPASLRVRSGSGKALVKAVARKLLPAAIVDRPKSGFGVPLARWFREERGLSVVLDTALAAPEADIFNRPLLNRLVAEHREGGQDHSEVLWTALNLVTWRQSFHV